MSLKKALSYSAVESIGSRVFDFITLWVVLNTLETSDLAKFGLATSAIFMFNMFLMAPETALFKYQKQWGKSGVLEKYLSAFVSFSVFKISLHYIAAIVVLIVTKELSWAFYAVVFSAITQQIQAAEISRIFHRMELKQRKVAHFEIVSKVALMALCLVLFFKASIKIYFAIYFGWSFFVAFLWLYNLNRTNAFSIGFSLENARLVRDALSGYSFWTHISGVMTVYIYNGSLLFLGWLGTHENDIALYTVINKVANLFFVIPMFFQSFVPVVLANSGIEYQRKFNKVLLASGAFSVAQFLFFLLFGRLLGQVFGLETQSEINTFYELGLIASSGILILNVSRPISTYLLIKSSPKRVMLCVFMPAVLFASLIFPVAIKKCALMGAAYASAFIYLFVAALLLIQYIQTLKKNHEDICCYSNV
ncbi:MAG: hypothetical protein D6B27_07635 [Gammaproteobacteria bacterium]|nr:MAG: hypothetical protein D6B27_07635 [Gammaproteobacteria bacterium]